MGSEDTELWRDLLTEGVSRGLHRIVERPPNLPPFGDPPPCDPWRTQFVASTSA